MIPLESIRQPIAQLCIELNVARLDIFGSAVTDRFSKTSDVDIVVAFDDHKRRFDRYFLLKEGMEDLLGRPVDLVVDDAIRNPYFREAVEESRVNVYTARHKEQQFSICRSDVPSDETIDPFGWVERVDPGPVVLIPRSANVTQNV